jgi:hypothetical protein
MARADRSEHSRSRQAKPVWCRSIVVSGNGSPTSVCTTGAVSSLNQWIVTAVAQKIGVVETAAAFFRQRAGRAKPDDLERIMQKLPDAPVDPEDMIPPDLAKRLSRLQ